MRGNCFESEQIWWREIRADDNGCGVIRIRGVEGCGDEGVQGWGLTVCTEEAFCFFSFLVVVVGLSVFL